MSPVLLRRTGWVLIAGGLAVAAYLGWQVMGTGVGARAAQSDLLTEWVDQVGDGPRLAGDEDHAAVDAPMEPLEDDAAVAVLAFERPGGDAPIPGPLAVVAGVTLDELARGPGRYPGSAEPGAPGNFAVAGHRTTYGAPFAALDDLRPDDEVHVTGRDGRVHVYRVVDQRIVDPDEVWVISSDPLERGRPMLTLTTCHPRFSNRQRLVVFAELVD